MPFIANGMWKGTVQRLSPQNKLSNWEGSWKPDGPKFAVNSVDILDSVLLNEKDTVINGSYLNQLQIKLKKVISNFPYFLCVD